MRQKYTEEQKQEIFRLWDTGNYTKTELSKHLNLPFSTISKFISEYGYVCFPPGSWKRKYSVNHDYFESIDTEEKAYILGFLYADGYNYEKKGVIQMKLHKQDASILEKINDILQPEKKLCIKGNKRYVEMYINSRKLSQDLAKWGCVQKKSLVLQFPDFLSESLIPHFIRGYFDGDGSIHCNFKTRVFSFGMIGTKDIVENIQQYLIENYDFTTTKILERSVGNATLYIISYAGIYNALKIREVLYSEASIYLQRKYDKFFSIPLPMRKKKRSLK